MKRSVLSRPLPLLLAALLLALPLRAGLQEAAAAEGRHAHGEHAAAVPGKVPLLEGVIDLGFPITTDQRLAQQYFNQGLLLTYGFDHVDAGVTFMEAARHDPEAAMAYWGAAFVLGPNINAPMDPAAAPRAYELSRKALELSRKATPKEKALIEALTVRYSPEATADRAPLDRAFAEKMREVYRRFPDDPNVAVLFAESLMDLHPWNYWKEDDQPQPWTPEIEAVLETVISGYPRHPHGHHLYIHLLENSPKPEATVKSADILRHLAPASGHLVHMAGHAYYAAGFYHDCSVVNEEAIGVDKKLDAAFDTMGLYQLAYMPHNLHFLLASYTMEGRSRDAVATARTLASGVDPEMMRQPGLVSLQHFYLTPYYTLVRFGRWEEILKEPAPASDLKYPRAMWHYARGMAFARQGDPGRAGEEEDRLRALAGDASLAELRIWDLNKVTDLLGIAAHVLSGEIAAARGDMETAVQHFERGVALQDGLTYDEPPTWYFPVRQSLGTLLLKKGDAEEAEKVFRRDVLKNEENPFSLLGLSQALKAQGKELEATEAERRFRRSWARSDVELRSPVF